MSPGFNGVRMKKSVLVVGLVVLVLALGFYVFTQRGPQSQDGPARTTTANNLKPAARGQVIEPDEAYHGSYRVECKTTLYEGGKKSFTDLASLIAWLPTKAEMKRDHPHITAKTKRLPEEEHYVTVDAYIYAIKKEDNDNDFHVIMGSTPQKEKDTKFMAAEVSGLREGGTCNDKLQVPRDELKRHFGDRLPGYSYHTFDYYGGSPIPVKVSGPLFFDKHPAGGVGTKDYKTTTSWEIHPVADMIF